MGGEEKGKEREDMRVLDPSFLPFSLGAGSKLLLPSSDREDPEDAMPRFNRSKKTVILGTIFDMSKFSIGDAIIIFLSPP